MRPALLALFVFVAPARAGLYYSAEVVAELPAQWNGFLPDLRTLRTLAAPTLANPLRAEYTTARDRLVKLAAERPLTAAEAADLGALHVRLGDPTAAVAVLRA